ncbi:MAG TPA: hypothetical protein VF406_03830 [Thermodesulfobacteriota bacterium]
MRAGETPASFAASRFMAQARSAAPSCVRPKKTASAAMVAADSPSTQRVCRGTTAPARTSGLPGVKGPRA